MKPCHFKEQNLVLAKDQPEYLPLPIYLEEGVEGKVVSCWRLSWRERVMVLFTGRIWSLVLTFNNPFQPTVLCIDRPFVKAKVKRKRK